mgnify:CR=1 FL=1
MPSTSPGLGDRVVCETVNPNLSDPFSSSMYLAMIVTFPTPDGPHTMRGWMVLAFMSVRVRVRVRVLVVGLMLEFVDVENIPLSILMDR